VIFSIFDPSNYGSEVRISVPSLLCRAVAVTYPVCKMMRIWSIVCFFLECRWGIICLVDFLEYFRLQFTWNTPTHWSNREELHNEDYWHRRIWPRKHCTCIFAFMQFYEISAIL